ncbi:hypothetical protein [Pseudactinotalea sp. HY158]|uniref:hypothetical protein n=1 Tax=Pseudactinotalea sp. HY158 TaxID=2654547 RepID=UPI00129CD441|nr:hypothetical protein [Pseudactinotalea sp. HY158]QGH69054.1 hypothetical protein GCE65_05705 [Pseudactinotalea sp. HY158]
MVILEHELLTAARTAGLMRAEASRLLRNTAARAARGGMSQRRIAQAMGRSQPEIHRLVTASELRDAHGEKRRWMTARSSAEATREALVAGDESRAMRMLIQGIEHLRGLGEPEDIAEWSVEPRQIPDARFDALLRVLAARALRVMGEAVPEWATDVRALSEPWVIPQTTSQRARALEETPSELAELGIYATEADLSTL